MSDDREKYFCNYIVAFIDILGQKESLKNFPKLIHNNVELSDISIEETYVKKEKICNLANRWFKGESYVRNGIHEKMLSGKREEINIEYWGDAVLVYSQLNPSDLRNVYSVVLGCVIFMLIMLSEKIAIRGGLEIGVAFNKLDFGIYGSALFNSWSLAENVAKYPRIVVGEELVKFLSLCSIESYPDKINQGLAKECLDLVCSDAGDGRAIIDFLMCSNNRNFKDKKLFNSFALKGFDFVNSEFEKFKKDKNSKLAFRYALLRDYYLIRLNELGIELKNGE